MSTGEYGGGARLVPANYITVAPNNIYTLKRSIISGYVATRCYDKDYIYLGNAGYLNSLTSTMTFTTPSNCSFIKFIDESNNNTSKIQIELGGTATDYVQYQGLDITNINTGVLASLPNGIKDEVYQTSDGKWYKTQKIGKIVLNGNEGWSIDPTQELTNTYSFRCVLSNALIQGSNTNVGYMTNRFASNGSYMSDFEMASSWNAYENNSLIIRILKSRLSTPDVNGFKNWLMSNSTIVYYKLATPITTEITDDQIQTYIGETNIYTTDYIQPYMDYEIGINP